MTSLNNTELLPWHQESWDRFQWLKQNKKIPHAIILSAAPGLGKMHFGNMLTRSLFCMQPTSEEVACGQCKYCPLISAKTHPDYQEILSEESIKIEDIRAMQSLLFHSAQQGGWKVVVIAPAEAMTVSAANSLLKILEEPPANTVFLLITTSLHKLLPTIRSRCEKWTFPGVSEEMALSWLRKQHVSLDQTELLALLRQHNHAPLAVMDVLSSETKHSTEILLNEFTEFQLQQISLTELATRWSKYNIQSIFQFLLHYSNDIARIACGSERTPFFFLSSS